MAIKQLKYYQVNEKVEVQLIKMSLSRSIEEITKFIKNLTRIVPLSAMKDAVFF